MRRTLTTKTTIAALAAGALVVAGSATAIAAANGKGSPRDVTTATGTQQCDENHAEGQAKQRKGAKKGQGAGGQRGSGERGRGGHSQGSTAALGTLTAEQEAEMIYMAEEEKMAGDLYEAFADMYDARVFDNIAASEDRHWSSVQGLLVSYEIADPTVSLAPGEFSLPEIQALYDDLLAQGSTGLEEALAVGVLVEETDIADLSDAIADLDAPRAQEVYESLLAGSTNHLAAFSR